jgi:hypothetical protein
MVDTHLGRQASAGQVLPAEFGANLSGDMFRRLPGRSPVGHGLLCHGDKLMHDTGQCLANQKVSCLCRLTVPR